MQNVFDLFEERGFVEQVSDRNLVRNQLERETSKRAERQAVDHSRQYQVIFRNKIEIQR